MMLDAHSKLAIPPETDFGPARDAFESGGVEAAVATILGGGLWNDYKLSAEDFARRVEGRAVSGLGDLMRAFYELYAERRGKPRWGDKSPYYLLGMTEIQRILPEARFVHLIRDGRDVALSVLEAWFGANDVAAAAAEWSHLLSRAREQAPALRFYSEVRYEDLVHEPAATLRRLCEYLELEWEEAMLGYHRHSGRRLSDELGDAVAFGTPVSRAQRLEMWRRVGSPPQPDRAERWRREMAAEDRRAFNSVAGETLAAFGYAPD